MADLHFKGRGTSANPANRFVPVELTPDFDHSEPGEWISPATQVYEDLTKSIIAENDSPDVGFRFSLNPYRGCEHGCIYCYARPTHEYFGLSAGLDFETKIFAKRNAPELLIRELSSAKWKGDGIAFSGVTDCYQPVERKLQLTRRCLEVLAECGNPAFIITKSHLVTRDIDLLSAMAARKTSAVFLSVTTLDDELAARLEPRASRPRKRLEAIEMLSAAGIPVGVMVAPLLPGLTEHELPNILKACADRGAITAAYVALRLPFAVKVLFEAWVKEHYPDRAAKVLNRIREIRGGKLNDPNFGSRMKGEGIFAAQIQSLFRMARKRAGLDRPFPDLTTEHFRRPSRDGQLSLL